LQRDFEGGGPLCTMILVKSRLGKHCYTLVALRRVVWKI